MLEACWEEGGAVSADGDGEPRSDEVGFRAV